MDAYYKYILPRYILPFSFGNVDSRDYHGFSWFHNCFLPFPLVFPHVSPGVLTVLFGVFPVSSQCFPCFLFWIFRILATEMYKLTNNLSLRIMNRVFKLNSDIRYGLR